MMLTRCRTAGSSGELDKMLAMASEPLVAPAAAAPALSSRSLNDASRHGTHRGRVSMRTAAYLLAVRRVADANVTRGIYP